MKVGVKVWSRNADYAEKIAPYVDFIEVLAMDLKHLPTFKKIGIPMVVHNPHLFHGINFADREKHQFNLASVLVSLRFADELNSKVVILHPGEAENILCNLGNVISSISRIGDERIFVENMPFVNKATGKNIKAFGAQFDEVCRIISGTKTRFCLDFSHAMGAAVSLNAEPYEYASRFLKLNPRIFHISDIKTNQDDGHLHFGEGNINLGLLKKMIPKDSLITIETPLDFEKQKSDIIRIKQFG